MRVGIVGGGLAGSLLAWRLAQQPGVTEVRLAPGAPAADATAASGGAVRAYELKPAQRALALASMAELAADPVLRDWSGFTECGSVYLPAGQADLADAVTEINAMLPASASLVDAEQLASTGWAGLTPDRIGIAERQAGYLDPHRFRRSVLADLAGRSRVRLLPAGQVSRLAPGSFDLAGERHSCDVVVLAAGAWTPAVLRQAGYDPGGLTTRSIQYTIWRASGALSTTFVDDDSGLFGKPAPEGLLLGLPTTGWAAPASGVPADEELAQRAAELATSTFPALRLHSAEPSVTAIDCYAESGLLELRPVPGADNRLLTFTGGSGSAAKTVLAASQRAAAALAETRWPPADADETAARTEFPPRNSYRTKERYAMDEPVTDTAGMIRNSRPVTERPNYDDVRFSAVRPGPEHAVGHYHQDGDLVTVEIGGGNVCIGRLVGSVDPAGVLTAGYGMVLADGEVIAGRCVSTPAWLPDGRLLLTEQWQRIDGSSGTSYIASLTQPAAGAVASPENRPAEGVPL